MTVGQLLASISSAELTEWQAFDSVEPIGERRSDIQAGLIAATVANYSVNPPKRPHSPSAFSLKWNWSMPSADNPQERAAQIRALLNSKAGG